MEKQQKQEINKNKKKTKTFDFTMKCELFKIGKYICAYLVCSGQFSERFVRKDHF